MPVFKLDGAEGDLAKTWRKRPVLLMTGSLTCPVARRQYENARDIAVQFRDDLYVVVVYTVEAHPESDASPYGNGRARPSSANRREGIRYEQPTALEQRLKLAREFKERVDIGVTMAVDKMDNSLWKRLGGGPNMGILVDTNGKVVAKHGWFHGPSMTRSIEAMLGKQQTPTTQPAN